MLAVVDARGDEAASAALALGERVEDFNEAQVRRLVLDLVGQYHDSQPEELNVGRVLLDLAAGTGQYGFRLPSELPLLGKTLLNLNDIGTLLAPDFNLNKHLLHNASSLMRRRMLRALTPAHLMSSALEVRDFAERLPQRLNKVLDALSANDLRLKVEVIDHGAIIDGLQKVANRIALGIGTRRADRRRRHADARANGLHHPWLPRSRHQPVPGRRRGRIVARVDDPRRRRSADADEVRQHPDARPPQFSHLLDSF